MKRSARLIALPLFFLASAVAASGDQPLRDKTLVAWVAPGNLTQRGGSVLTLIDKAEHFDAIVLGELAQGKWMAGNDFFRRTHQDQANWPLESAGPGTLVQLAISYRGDRVTIFRNGKEYAVYPIGQAQPFGDDATVLIGLRYIGEMGEIGFSPAPSRTFASTTRRSAPSRLGLWFPTSHPTRSRWRGGHLKTARPRT